MISSNAEKYLNSFVNLELNLDSIKPGSMDLSRVKELLDVLGNPQKEFLTVQVLGTNGKGSTALYAASILKAVGYQVGLYTSPHLHNIQERIRILEPDTKKDSGGFSGMIQEDQWQEVLAEIKPHVQKLQEQADIKRFTFFEVLTVTALCYFRKKKVDVAILEAGLGGRLDATSAADAAICAFSSIGWDHTQQLGDSLKRIAGEKAAAITRKDQKVVCASQQPETWQVLKGRCEQLGIIPAVVGEDIHYQPVSCDDHSQDFMVDVSGEKSFLLKTVLLGRYQAENIALAILIVKALRDSGVAISKQAVIRGIRSAHWPGRFEFLRRDPIVVVDGAHNPSSAQALARSAAEIFAEKRIILVFGVSRGKDLMNICKAFDRFAEKIIMTKAGHPRALDPEDCDLSALFPNKEISKTNSVKEALSQALAEAAEENKAVLCAGSLFLAGEIRALLLEEKEEKNYVPA